MRKVVILFMMVSLFACGKHDKNENKEYLFLQKEQVRVSDMMKDYSFIPLETTDDSLILDATVVKISGGKIFVLDSFSPSKSLYVFQLDGKYVGKIGAVGNGPGEYIMPYNLMISEASNRLFIQDIAMNKLLAFDLATGRFVEDYAIPFYAGCVELLDEEHFIWYVNAGSRNKNDFVKHLQITNLKCEPISSHIAPMNFPNRGLYNVISYFTREEGMTLFHHPFMGEYYVCSSNDSILRPAFSLKLEHHPFPTEEYITNHKDNIIKDLEAGHYIQWCNVFRNASTLLCYAGCGKEIYWGVYDIEKQTGWYIDRLRIVDDWGIGKLGRPKTVYNDYFVNTIFMEQDFSESAMLKKYVATDNAKGNPLLFLYKLTSTMGE